MEKHLLDAFLITNPSNVSYITQYIIEDSYLLITPYENFIITDFRYIEEIKTNIKGFSICQINGSLFNVISSLIKKLNIKRLGFESRHLPFAEYDKIHKLVAKHTKLVPAIELVEKLRVVKDKTEISLLKKSTKITTDMLLFLKDVIKPGVSELDISGEANQFLRKKGASSASFAIIVASGSRSSMPHAKTSSKIIQNNEPVLVDIGVNFCGYKSDLTRMFFLGKIHRDIKEAFEVVFAAKKKAIDKLKPGIAIAEIDAIARNYIGKFGWSKNFGHGLGHGIGLDVHEDPAITRKNSSLLKTGMVFTIEPAVYFPAEFGIRLEDMVLITDKGCKILNGSLDNTM